MIEQILPAAIKGFVLLNVIMGAAAYFVLLERRVAAWVQDRRGPNRVGLPVSVFFPRWQDVRLFGLGQPLADGIKMIIKEEYTPAQVDRRLFVLAPLIIMAAALAIFAVIPFGSQLPAVPGLWDQPLDLVVAPDLDVGLIYIFALSQHCRLWRDFGRLGQQ